jgi:hypothetical protein
MAEPPRSASDLNSASRFEGAAFGEGDLAGERFAGERFANELGSNTSS